MSIRFLSTFLAFYFICALVGGVADGKFLTTNTEGTIEGIAQTDALVRNPYEGLGWNVVGWFTATYSYIGDWAGVLTLNFSIFQGTVGTIFRSAILTIVCAPILYKMLIDRGT